MSQRRPYAARVPMPERREQLLDAAIAVIVRDGYAGVSVDAIAREAGVTRPVVYGAFDGLGALLEALLDRQQGRALAQLAEALPAQWDPDDPTGLLLETVSALVRQVTGDPLTWRPILLAPQQTPDVVRARIDADRERVREQIAALVAAAVPPREGAADAVDVELVSHALIAVLEHLGRLLLEDPERFEPERLGRFAAVVVGALGAGHR